MSSEGLCLVLEEMDFPIYDFTRAGDERVLNGGEDPPFFKTRLRHRNVQKTNTVEAKTGGG